MDKKILRADIKKILSGLSQEFIFKESLHKAETFLASEIYKKSHVILSYSAMKNECNPEKITKTAMKDLKITGLPKTSDKKGVMDFFLLNPQKSLEEQLVQGNYGIMEPLEDKNNLFECSQAFSNKNICVIVPGLAFTPSGKRLGRGAAFYDNYLAELLQKALEVHANVTLVGFCMDCQILTDIPVEDHDIKMDFIL